MRAMFARQRGERQPGQRAGRSLPGFIGSDLGDGLFAAKVDDGFETHIQISRLEMVQAGSEGTIEQPRVY